MSKSPLSFICQCLAGHLKTVWDTGTIFNPQHCRMLGTPKFPSTNCQKCPKQLQPPTEPSTDFQNIPWQLITFPLGIPTNLNLFILFFTYTGNTLLLAKNEDTTGETCQRGKSSLTSTPILVYLTLIPRGNHGQLLSMYHFSTFTTY